MENTILEVYKKKQNILKLLLEYIKFLFNNRNHLIVKKAIKKFILTIVIPFIIVILQLILSFFIPNDMIFSFQALMLSLMSLSITIGTFY